MRVLNWPAMTGETIPDRAGRAVESQRHQTRVVEQRVDRRGERAQRETIAWCERRWHRPILGACAKVAGAEHDRHEFMDVVRRQRTTAGEAPLEVGAPRQMHAVQAGRERCRIVGNHQIAGLQEIRETRSRSVSDAPSRVDDEELGVPRPLDGTVGRDHVLCSLCSMTATRSPSAAAIASANSRAEVSGRSSVAGSASGTANACSGVSMSPGSSERKRTPSADSSSFQIRLMWCKAALLAPYAPQDG